MTAVPARPRGARPAPRGATERGTSAAGGAVFPGIGRARGDYRAACVWARFDAASGAKDPPGGLVALDEEDFHPVHCAEGAPDCVALDLATDCVGSRSP